LFFYYFLPRRTGAQAGDYLLAKISTILGISVEMPDDLTTIVPEESA